MISAEDLLLAIKDAWENDQAINDFCIDKFGVAPTVQIGLDDQAPPQNTDYPIIAVPGLTRRGGMGSRDIEWNLNIGAAVLNDEITRENKSVVYPGLFDALCLRGLAEDAVLKLKLGAVYSDSESGEYSAHPIYVSYSVLKLTEHKSSRR